MYPLKTVLACIASLLLVGCAGEEEAVDPEFEVGFVQNGAFVPLADGDTCIVVSAIQVGYWIMPTVHTAGMGDVPYFHCTATDDTTQTTFANLEGTRPVVASDDGLWDEAVLQVPTDLSMQEFFDIAGHTGTFTCTAGRDAGDPDAISISVQVNFEPYAAGS